MGPYFLGASLTSEPSLCLIKTMSELFRKFNKYNVGTVPIFNKYNGGTVLMFDKYNVGTLKN